MDTRRIGGQIMWNPAISAAIRMVTLANQHSFTFAHPAYRSAEEKIMALGTADAAVVLQETGGLKPVIGRGVRAS